MQSIPFDEKDLRWFILDHVRKSIASYKYFVPIIPEPLLDEVGLSYVMVPMPPPRAALEVPPLKAIHEKR